MAELLQLPPIDAAELDGVEPWGVVGEILAENLTIPYSKADLQAYWAGLAEFGDVHIVSSNVSHGHNFLINIRVGSARFTALFHDVGKGVLPPSIAMPQVLSAYSKFDRAALANSVILFSEPSSFSPDQLMCARFILEQIVLKGPIWSLSKLARDFIITTDNIPVSGYGLLIADAFSSAKIKHAYFDLFRCIEHQALISAKISFDASFLNDPKSAVDKISKAVSSERVLYSEVLQKQSAVLNGAANVVDELTKENRYMAELVAKTDNLPVSGVARAAHVLYAVRNSIAHAKAGDLMIERYPDYEAALERLIPYVEVVALRFAGIELDSALA